MRRFRVGDRVRFEQGLDSNTPRWTFSSDWPGSGKFCEGVVIKVDDNDSTFGVRPDNKSLSDWWWPQPDRPGSRYGSQGYLELVEAIEKKECRKCGGDGWLWGRELDNPSEDTYQDDMTKYPCDRCSNKIDEEQPQETINIMIGIKKESLDAVMAKAQSISQTWPASMRDPEIGYPTERHRIRYTSTAQDDSQKNGSSCYMEQSLSRSWLHESDTAIPRKVELIKILRDQLRVAITGVPPPCACCGVQREWHQLHRCFFCGLWFCVRCGKKHFGSR